MAEEVGGGPIHVLVVDDCLVYRRIVEKLLKTLPCKVISAESGKQAMEILMWSQESKLDRCGDNNERNDFKSIPVVVMSSEHDPQRITRCLASGPEAFLQKPLQPKILQKLRTYLNSVAPVAKKGTTRKVTLDLIAESNVAETKPRFAGFAVA